MKRLPSAKGAKKGVAPGSTPGRDKRDGGARPIEEEDVFGGVERAHKGERVSSPNAKP